MSLLYRLTALPAVTTFDDTDIMVGVDISAGTIGTSKITVANLRTVLIGTAIVVGAAALVDVGRLTKVGSAGTLAEANILDNCSGIVTLTKAGATARVVTLPDAAFTIAGQDLANTFSANQTVTGGTTPGTPGATSVIIGGGTIAIGTSLSVGVGPSSSTALRVTASTTTKSSLRIGHGSAPTSPVNGDVWTTTAGMFVQINGSTISLGAGTGTIGGSIAVNQIAVGSGTDTIGGSSSLTWDGTALNTTGVSGLGIAASSTTALNLAVGTTGVSSLRIGHGVAPTSPVNGDVWTTTAGMFVRINGSTVALGTGTFSGSISINQIAYASGSNALTGSANFTWDGTSFTVTGKSGLNIAASSTTALNLSVGTTGVSSLRIGHGVAPTSPVNGDVWTTTSGLFIQINGSTIQVAATGIYLPLAGGTMTGKLITVASASGGAGFNIPLGVIPTSPVDGDIWMVTGSGGNVGFRINSSTRYFASFATIGQPSANQVMYSAGAVGGVITGDSTFTWDTATLSIGSVQISTTNSSFIISPASTTTKSSLRLAHGSAPTSPVNGDIWTTTSGIFVRINGTTRALSTGSIGGSIAANQIAVGSGTNTISGASSFTATSTSGAIIIVHNPGTSTAGTTTNLHSVTGTWLGAFNGSSNQILTTANFTLAANNTTSNDASGTIYRAVYGSVSCAPVTTATVMGNSTIIGGDFSSAFTGIVIAGGSTFTSLIGVRATVAIADNGSGGTSSAGEIICLQAKAGAFSAATSNTLTISVFVGLDIPTLTTSGAGTVTITNRYGIRQSDTAAINYFAGIGSFGTTPSSTTALNLVASTTGVSSLRLAHGTAPTSPVNGDIWTTTTGMYVQINGSTVALGAGSIAGTIANQQIAVGSGTDTIGGSSSLTWTGAALTVSGRAGINISSSTTTSLNLAVGTTGVSSLRIGHGVAPTSPVNGDIWTTTAGLFIRINGSTVQMGTGNGTVTISGSPTSNQIAFFTASTVISSDSNLLYDGTTLELVSGSSRMTIGTAASSSTKLNLAAATTSFASLRLGHGVAPTSPVNGDMWTTTSGLFVRINGSTVALGGASAITGSATANYVAVGSGANTITGTASVQWDGTFFFVNGYCSFGITASASAAVNIQASSTGNSAIRIAAGAAPTSPTSGDIWHDTALKAMAVYVDSLKQTLLGVIFTQTAISTDVTNTTTATTILTTGTGTKQLQANFFTVGKTLRLTIKGRISSAVAETGTIDIKLDSTTIVSTGSVTLSSFSNNEFEITVYITCYTTGASGTVAAIGQMSIANPGVGSLQVGFSNSAAQTLDTTTSYLIDAKMTWGSTSSSDHLTSQTCSIEVLN